MPRLSSMPSPQKITEHRRILHTIPEKRFEEHKTAEYITSVMRSLGYTLKTGLAGTGITAELDSGRPGPCLLFRADMDALPIWETQDIPYASKHPGWMHACGHDGHMAMLLGAAEALKPAIHELRGKIRFLFQPAEEGTRGAARIVACNVLDGVDMAFGMHLWPAVEHGRVGVREGPVMAAAKRFTITIRGKSAHGSEPQTGIDALDAGCQVVNALQRLVSRKQDPRLPTVLTVGEFHAGTAPNIIADTAVLRGSARTYDMETWNAWPQKIKRVVENMAASMDATAEIEYEPDSPVLDNHPAATELARKAAARCAGEERVVEQPLFMASEDFTEYSTRVPSCFLFLGTGPSCGLHTPNFNFNEDVLALGTELWCEIALLGLDATTGGSLKKIK